MSVLYQTLSTDTFNVKGYGAIGDGITDDAPALQAAINAASGAGGGQVYIPAGQYLIGSTLKVNYGMIIKGDGRGRIGINSGSRLIWNSAGPCLLINSADSTVPVHQSEVRNLLIEGSGGIGLQIGESGITQNFAAPTFLHNVTVGGPSTGFYFLDCQICRMDYCWANSCDIGFHFAANPDGSHANTACTLTSCRAQLNGTGYLINRLTGSSFYGCLAENNSGEGFKVQIGGTNEAVHTVLFDNCWIESNSGVGFASDSTLSSAKPELTLRMPKFGGTPVGKYDMSLRCGIYTVDYPDFSQGMELSSSVASGGVTNLAGTWRVHPTGNCTVNHSGEFIRGHIFYLPELNDQGGVYQFAADNAGFKEIGRQRAGYHFFSDNYEPNTNKVARLVNYPYDLADLPPTMIQNTNTSVDNLVNVGGGSTGGAAATYVRTYAAANNNTAAGTIITEVTTTGLTLRNNAILELTLNGAQVRSGSGSPEGSVVAPVGSIYTDEFGGVGNTLYIKESGTGSAGWAAK